MLNLIQEVNRMWFDNLRVSEIEPQQIVDLINVTKEDQWLDFKQQPYQKDDEGKFEMLKDVTAMANAEGGYILLGVGEKNEIATGFFTIHEPDKVAKSIEYSCFQYIDPRIPALEVEPYPFEWNNKSVTIVIIHIPPSSMRPHCIKWKNSTVFVKRYQDHTRDIPISELGEAFSIRYYPQILNEINSKLNTIVRTTMLLLPDTPDIAEALPSTVAE